MTATKWSGLYHIAAFFCIAIPGTSARAGPLASADPGDRPDAGHRAGPGLIVPVGVYTASWTGWFLSADGYDRHVDGSGIIGTLKSWIRYQSER